VISLHAIRRESFVDVAQRLIQTKGYERMGVQDVLDELDASRGAFYHYFDSKVALLEAVVERMTDAALATMAPIATDSDLSALQKLESIFAALARWKNERPELMLALLRVWSSDDNAIVRDKFRQGVVTRLAPLLASIVHQGKREGLTPSSPDDVARVLVSLLLGLNERAVELFIARQAKAIGYEDVERTVAAYTEAIERILGLTAGCLTIVDEATLRRWFG
jgi:AcrR family transcriptional regulator